MAGRFTNPWRRRPAPPGGSAITRLVGYGLVVVAVAFFVFANRSAGPPAFDFDTDSMVMVWNEAAAKAGRPELSIGDLQQTSEDVVGFAWTPDLLVLGRIGEDTEGRLVELVAAGSPARDGVTDVLAVFDILIRVVDPDLDADGRRRVLQDLALADARPPADLRTSVRSDRFEFRATTDSANGQLGIGAVPILSD